VTDPAIDEATFTNLVEMTGGDWAFVDELVDTYLEDGVAQIEALRAAVASNSIADLVRPAHSMKSSSLNVGALQLGELARTLEEAGRSGQIPNAAEQVEAIATSFDGVRRELIAERGGRTAS
jgi:HPt (histidine-containing phosphotransfer) domain-containing protein